MRKGVRLCHAIQSPPLYDLKEIITPEDERQFAEHEREILRRASAEPLQVLSVGELTAIFSADGKNERLN
jgi:shikimate kinase